MGRYYITYDNATAKYPRGTQNISSCDTSMLIETIYRGRLNIKRGAPENRSTLPYDTTCSLNSIVCGIVLTLTQIQLASPRRFLIFDLQPEILIVLCLKWAFFEKSVFWAYILPKTEIRKSPLSRHFYFGKNLIDIKNNTSTWIA